MNPELIFKIINLAILPGWLLMFFFPKSKITEKVIYSYVYQIVISIVYAWFLFTNLGGPGGMSSLEGLQTSFQNEYILIAAWLHYLSFDLFVGAWELKDSQKRGISHLWMVPCLLFTLMLGPVGLVLYFGLRKLKSVTT